MKTKHGRFIAIAVFLFSVGGLFPVGTATSSWRSGRVISATVSGQGPIEDVIKKKIVRKTDIWWTYCISAGDLSYSVLSRESPEKSGLSNNCLIRFSEKKKQIYVVNPHGRTIMLRILRKDKSKKCP
jgi:hypothetical protein